jgi:F-type H+-transporting ATPase subunit delta
VIDPVAQRYAEALFNLASREGALGDVERDVRRLSAELERPGVGSACFDARVPLESRRAQLMPLLGQAHRLTRNFVNLLFDKRREEVLRGLGAAFHARALRERGALEGVAESARPLGAGDLAQLEASLSGRLGKTVSLKNAIRPELLGGVRVIVGSQMVDHSIQGRLAGLKKRLEEAPLASAARPQPAR